MSSDVTAKLPVLTNVVCHHATVVQADGWYNFSVLDGFFRLPGSPGRSSNGRAYNCASIPRKDKHEDTVVCVNS